MKHFFIVLFLMLSSMSVYAQKSVESIIRDGVALHDKGEYKKAIECYKQALEKDPKSMSATYEMSLSYLSLKDYNNAIKYSSKILDGNFQPLMVDAYVVKSTALAESNKVDEAIQLLNEALVKCGDEYLLYFNLGISYFNQGQKNLAMTHLRKAIEIDATRPSALLLYAYSLSDTGRWIQSIYAFHYFLFLEPNTQRSKDAFDELYGLMTAELSGDKLEYEDGIDRQVIYNAIHKLLPKSNDDVAKFNFFRDASKTLFFTLGQMQNDTQNGLLWNFFVPTFDEILGSGHFDTYCRYVSVSYFDQSLKWWDENKTKVDDFIEWFDSGQAGDDEEAELGDDSDVE